MLGTLYNTVTVAAGASAGLLLRKRVPEKLRKAVFAAIGLFTLYIGVDMMTGIQRPIGTFIALVLGAGMGQAIGKQPAVRYGSDIRPGIKIGIYQHIFHRGQFLCEFCYNFQPVYRLAIIAIAICCNK